MIIELRNHPAQAQIRHPVTGARIPAVDKTGKPVPLITDQHGVYVALVDGETPILFGYCGTKPGKPLSLLYNVPQAIAEEIARFVEQHVGKVKGPTMPPPEQDTALEDDDDDE